MPKQPLLAYSLACFVGVQAIELNWRNVLIVASLYIAVGAGAAFFVGYTDMGNRLVMTFLLWISYLPHW